MKDKLKDYKCVPFWSWNDKLSPKELVSQISWMKSNGVGGFFMHARGGLITEYLGDDWFKCVDACVKKAKKADMNAWVYDENGWPSGFAGGKLLKDEENHDRYLTYKIGTFDEKSYVSYKIDSEKLERTDKGGDGNYLNIYDNIAVSTVDILNPEVVDKFLAETHEKYRAYYGEDFGKNITGFFTDEPQYQRWNTSFTKMMIKYFKEEYGEDLKDGLGLLFIEKEGYRSFRYKYWKGMQALFLKNFSKKIYDWCEKYGVKFTGHYVEESSLGGQMMCCAGIMPYYEYEHIPGIDWLARNTPNEIAPKQVGSVAAQLGKKQVLSEMFACCGWDVTAKELKAIAEFQYLGGVNLMCQHLLPVSEYGQRKRDYPAHYSDANPWVKEGFKTFNDYFTKLGFLLSNSVELVDTAILHPIRSCYFDYKRIEPGFGVEKLDEAFAETVEKFNKCNIPFHFIDETLLSKHGSVDGKKLVMGNCSYKYLIIPKIYTMDKSTEKLLREYVENGGKILLLDKKPQYLEGEPYDYGYLKSNIRFETLVKKQIFTVDNPNTCVYSTVRKNKKGTFIFAVNTSSTETYDLTFNMSRYSSFESYDVASGAYKVISNAVHFEPNTSYVLYMSNKNKEWAKPITEYKLDGNYELVSSTENYLTVDYAGYSYDGLNFSEKLSCIGILQLLLQNRYKGDLYLKYSFETEYVPKQIKLYAENMNTVSVCVNGKAVEKEGSFFLDKKINGYNIADAVKTGVNEVIIKIRYSQTEDVYYALFGEGVTESLRNCLVYKTNIESVYIGGDFGVYEKNGLTKGKSENVRVGNEFIIGKKKTEIKDFLEDGFLFFAGTVTVKKQIILKDKSALLKIGGRYHLTKLYVNGNFVKTLLFGDTADISEFAKEGTNEIVLEITKSNRNLLGPHHNEVEESLAVGPDTFEMTGGWKDGKNEHYLDRYTFIEW